MARTGNFGRAPRTAPSLTNTIIAIAREFQQTRDQNIMNAWEKGGTFEGKKATDKLVLKHWKERVNGVSKNDPLHDTYTQAVENLTYSIAESKMTAAYALKKKSDAQMVSFYLGWAKKVPKDSEFYRVLQRDAGQYMRTAKQSNQADIARLKEERYQTQQGETDKKYGAAAQFLTDTLRRLNQSGYKDGHLTPTLDAPGAGGRDDLTDFDPSDPETSMALLALIAPERQQQGLVSSEDYGTGAFAPNGDVLYHSDTKDPKTGKGKGVTGADIMKELAKLDPSYKPGMPIDVPYLTGLLDRQGIGIQEKIDRAVKTGHMQDAERYKDEKRYTATLARQVAAQPIEKAYLDARETYEKVMSDPTASPFAQKKARKAYLDDLSALSNDQRIATDDNMKARLQGEIDGKTDMPTLAESFTGNDTGGEAKDAIFQAGRAEFIDKQIDLVTRDMVKPDTDPTKMVWTLGSTNPSTGEFIPGSNGTEIGPATISDVKAGGQQAQVTTVDDPRGGQGISIMRTAVPVYGVAFDPVTGDSIPTERGEPIAWAYNFPSGSVNNVQLGYLTKDPKDPTKSVMTYSDAKNPPWADSLAMNASSTGGDHYEVDFSSFLPTQAAPNGAPGSVMSGIDATKAGEVAITGPDGKPIKGVHVGDVPAATKGNMTPTGVVTWDPYAVSRSTDVERNALGGTDPTTDFTSLTVAHLWSSRDGQAILKTIDSRPEFRMQIENDGYAYSGAMKDPKTGAYMPETADQDKLAIAAHQRDLLKNVGSIGEAINNQFKEWQRGSTGSPYPGHDTPKGTNPLGYFGKAVVSEVSKLGTDMLKGTSFQPLGDAFPDGSLARKQRGADQAEAFNIKVGPGIKVAGWEPKPITSTKTTTTGTVGASVGAIGTTPQPKSYTPPKQPTKTYDPKTGGHQAL